jgi:hypothetical protein
MIIITVMRMMMVIFATRTLTMIRIKKMMMKKIMFKMFLKTFLK